MVTSPYALQTFCVKNELLRTIYSLPPIPLPLPPRPHTREKATDGDPALRFSHGASLTGGRKARRGFPSRRARRGPGVWLPGCLAPSPWLLATGCLTIDPFVGAGGSTQRGQRPVVRETTSDGGQPPARQLGSSRLGTAAAAAAVLSVYCTYTYAGIRPKDAGRQKGRPQGPPRILRLKGAA